MTRYPLGPLLELMHEPSPTAAARRLRLSGGSLSRYLKTGMREDTAEMLAIRAGFHPYNVWPELADEQCAAVTVTCRECPARFVPKPHARFARYCSKRCQQRAWARARRATSEGAEANRAARRRYYAANGDYERARERRAYRSRRALST